MTEAQFSFDGDTDVVIRRSFTHPPARVWRALTEPALIRQWLSPDLIHCRVDARPGGSFRYDWPEFFFSGPVLDARAPRSIWCMSSISTATPRKARPSPPRLPP